jgi:hypothetical protein
MGHIASWKVLEDLMLELRRKGLAISPNVVNDLRSAKLMIKISESGSLGESAVKIDEFLGNVESILLEEARKTLGSGYIDEWIRRIDEANIQCETCIAKKEENKFITGVPRDQKWVRVEPTDELTSDRLTLMAKESNLTVNTQKDGLLLVFGQKEKIKEFLKKMTEETTKNKDKQDSA